MSKEAIDDTNASTQDGNESGGSTSDAGTDAFTPPSSQEELNRIIEKRLERERSKYADYDDLRKRAAKLDEIEAEQMSEVEKAQKRAEEAEAAAEKARTEMLRFRVASKHGISSEDAELFLTGADEETLTAQAQRLADRESLARNRTGAVSPNEGRHASPPPETLDDQFAEWAEAQLTR